jgi:integrase
LGTYPALGLAGARAAALDAIRAAKQGQDIQAKKVDARKRSTPRALSSELAGFVEVRKSGGMRSWREMEGLFEKEVTPVLGDYGLSEVTDADIADLLRKIRAPSTANKVHVYLSSFFKWARAELKIRHNPAVDIVRPRPEAIVSRDRFLSDGEIAEAWAACGVEGYPFGDCLKLALLLGQRRDEVAGIQLAHIDLDEEQWEIPRALTKSDRTHLVPLPSQAMLIFDALPVTESSYLFTTTGRGPIRGFSKAKIRIDGAINTARAKNGIGPIPPWRIHDLRRTVASGLARLKVPPIVVEKIQNRATGEGAGVAGVYNRYSYLDERRAALEQWGDYVEQLVKPRDQTGNVERFSRKSG